MTITSTAINPFHPDNLADPFDLYRRMRALGPVIWLEEVGVWAVFRDAQCREVVTDASRFGSAGGGGVANYYREKPWRAPSVVFEVDPPDHTRTRRVLGRTLSMKVVRELEERTAAMAVDLVDGILAAGRFDGIADFGKPLVMRIIPDALGLAPEGRENLLTYNYYLLKGRGAWRHLPWTEEERAEAERVTTWVASVCERENLTTDGLGAQIYAAADAGEISTYEAGMLVRSFLSAGTDTTFGAIANTLNFLMTYRDQWDKLRANPTLARNAYEEGMRFRGPAQIIARNTLNEMEYCGTRLGQHDKVIAFVGSANRDPERWQDPDSFQIERNAAGHLALGVGIHGCVGQMIARMEAEKLLGELARRVPDMRIGPGGVQYSASGRVIERLDLEVVGGRA